MDTTIETKRPQPTPVKTDSLKKGWYTIHIPKTKDDVRDVFVSPNFRPYQIKRGVDVDVPPEVVDALNSAVQTNFIPQDDPLNPGRRINVPQDVLAYPFQIKRYPTT